ncbi:hypothetical protein Ancab_034490 [Ancistrocladus abbreviatus]
MTTTPSGRSAKSVELKSPTHLAYANQKVSKQQTVVISANGGNIEWQICKIGGAQVSNAFGRCKPEGLQSSEWRFWQRNGRSAAFPASAATGLSVDRWGGANPRRFFLCVTQRRKCRVSDLGF